MPYLSWISDADLESEVSFLIETAKSAKAQASTNFSKNVIDPFSAMFQMSGFGINHGSWKQLEENRKAEKTLQNHIGEFHQKVLGHVEGWVNVGKGSVVDLHNESSKIVAEIKNKYNTVSGGQLASFYHSLDELISPKHSSYKGYTAYFVSIIPKNKSRYNRPFTPSDKSKGQQCPSNELIREIDGASFYHLVTGDKNALNDLFSVTPKVIKKVGGTHISEEDFQLLRQYLLSAFDFSN